MSNIPRTPKRLDFQKLCLRYYLQRSGTVKKIDPSLVPDLLNLCERVGISVKEPTKADDLFLKGLFDVSVKMRGKESPWFEFKKTIGTLDLLLARWRENLSKPERYELYLQCADSLRKFGSRNDAGAFLADFQHGLALAPEECDRIRNGRSENHNITTVSILRLLAREEGLTRARNFIRRNYHFRPTSIEELVRNLRSKNKHKIEKLSQLLESYLKSPRLSPLEERAFKKFSEKFKTSKALVNLTEPEVMLLLKPLLLQRSRLRFHPFLLKEMRSWFKNSERELITIAAKLNQILYALGTRPLMDRKLADVLEELLGHKRPHFPDPGDGFRREFYVFLQTDLGLLGKTHRSFAASLLRPVDSPVTFPPEKFVYELLKAYIKFRNPKKSSYQDLEMSKKTENEFWEILRELKIPRDSVLKALRLIRLHHQIVLRLPSSQLSIAA